MTDKAKAELMRYGVGVTVSGALTAFAFWAVMGAGWSKSLTLWVIGIAAVAQIGVQLRCFLHIGWSQKREDLQLILFSLLLLGLMVGGTIWIMSSLATRM